MSNCPILHDGVKLSYFAWWCQIVLGVKLSAVSNCPPCLHGVKLSYLPLWCQIVRSVKWSAVSNGPRINWGGGVGVGGRVGKDRQCPSGAPSHNMVGPKIWGRFRLLWKSKEQCQTHLILQCVLKESTSKQSAKMPPSFCLSFNWGEGTLCPLWGGMDIKVDH